MIIGKKLIGDGAEQYLPFALSKLRFMATQYTGAMQSRTIRADDATILLELNDAEHGQVTIWAGGAGYEFFTTGAELHIDESIGSDSLGMLQGYAVKIDKGKKKPLGSTYERDTQDPPRWPYNADANEMSQMFSRKNIWQVQGNPQHTFFPKAPLNTDGSATTLTGTNPGTLLVDSWSVNNPLASMCMKAGEPNHIQPLYDIFYDQAPALFSGNAALPAGGYGLAPDADWYKRAATRTVIHPDYGSRTFIILSDASNVFHAYPITEIDDTLAGSSPYASQFIKTNVPEQFVQRQAAPLPAWCRKPTSPARDFGYLPDGSNATEYLMAVPQYRWAFNSTATRACAIAFEDLPTYSINGVTPNAMTPDGTPYNLTESLPGLVEFDLAINLTGPNPQDFTLMVTLRAQIQPTVEHSYVMAADYAWIVAGASALDDLILMQGELYYSLPDRTVPNANAYAGRSIITIRNDTAGTAVRRFLGYDSTAPYSYPVTTLDIAPLPIGSTQYTARSSILAFDLRILAFVVQQRVVKKEYIWSGDPTLYTATTRRRADKIITVAYNKLVETRRLDTASPLNTLLDAAHDDPNSEGLYFYDPADVGNTAPTVANYFYRHLNTNASLYGKFPELLAVGSNFNAGAFLYLELVASCLNLHHHTPFTVHPDGHWSVFTHPVLYHGGNGGITPDNIDLSAIKQDFVDIISYQSKGRATRTTHLEAFNTAFGKSLKKADYLFSFSVENVVTDKHSVGQTPDGENYRNTDTYIKATGKNTGDAAYFYLYGRVFNIDDPDYARQEFAGQLTDMDLLYPYKGMFDSMRQAIGITGSLYRNSIGQRTLAITYHYENRYARNAMQFAFSILRGSSLFYGKTK